MNGRFVDGVVLRGMLAKHAQAAEASTCPAVRATVPILREALHGNPDRECLLLMALAPRDRVTETDGALYSAAICLGTAIWEAREGQDASVALANARIYLGAVTGMGVAA